MNGELPAGWIAARLGDVSELNPRHPRDLADTLKVSFAPMAAVSEAKPEFNYLEDRLLGAVRTGFTHFADGDVLFAKITPCMENGKGAVARGLQNGLGCGTTELHVFRPKGGISSDYVYRFLSQPAVRREAKEHFTGSAGQGRVPLDFMADLEIPLAPIAEQRRISAKLEAVLGAVDACQRRLAKIPAILKRFRQSVLAAACSGRLTAEWREASVEDSWNEVTLGEVLEDIHGGKSFSCTERPPREDEVGVLKISAITSGLFDEKESKTCTNKALVNPLYFVRTGDLLMSRANTIELVGAVAIVGHVEGKLMLSDKTLRLQVTPAVTPQWVWYWLRSDFGRSQIENLATGNQQSMRNISRDSIRSIRIQIPPREEQKQIEAAVQLLFDKAEHVARRFRFADAAVKKLRGSILAKAFRGELVPTEAELADIEGRSFESAEELLARIAAKGSPARDRKNGRLGRPMPRLASRR